MEEIKKFKKDYVDFSFLDPIFEKRISGRIYSDGKIYLFDGNRSRFISKKEYLYFLKSLDS